MTDEGEGRERERRERERRERGVHEVDLLERSAGGFDVKEVDDGDEERVRDEEL
jgi:hypothetical protein